MLIQNLVQKKWNTKESVFKKIEKDYAKKWNNYQKMKFALYRIGSTLL